MTYSTQPLSSMNYSQNLNINPTAQPSGKGVEGFRTTLKLHTHQLAEKKKLKKPQIPYVSSVIVMQTKKSTQQIEHDSYNVE